MSILIKLDSSSIGTVKGQFGNTSDDFTVYYPSGLSLDNPKDWEVALVKMSFTYNIFNISDIYNNRTFKYKNAVGTLRTLTIPEGSYNIEELNNWFILQQEELGDFVGGTQIFELKPNYSTLRAYFEIEAGLGTTAIILDTGNLYQLLGFSVAQKNTELKASLNYGDDNANINNGIISLNINCSIATGSFDNARASNILYSAGLRATPGDIQDEEPSKLIYLPLNISDAIYRINMKITDQQNRPISLNNEPVSYVLHLRKKKHLL